MVTLSALAARRGVSEAAVEGQAFPGHERVGRTLVRPAVLDDLGERVEADLDEATDALESAGVTDASAARARLPRRVDSAAGRSASARSDRTPPNV